MTILYPGDEEDEEDEAFSIDVTMTLQEDGTLTGEFDPQAYTLKKDADGKIIFGLTMNGIDNEVELTKVNG